MVNAHSNKWYAFSYSWPQVNAHGFGKPALYQLNCSFVVVVVVVFFCVLFFFVKSSHHHGWNGCEKKWTAKAFHSGRKLFVFPEEFPRVFSWVPLQEHKNVLKFVGTFWPVTFKMIWNIRQEVHTPYDKHVFTSYIYYVIALPWYNRNGWLGVKHWVTYLCYCTCTWMSNVTDLKKKKKALRKKKKRRRRKHKL